MLRCLLGGRKLGEWNKVYSPEEAVYDGHDVGVFPSDKDRPITKSREMKDQGQQGTGLIRSAGG